MSNLIIATSNYSVTAEQVFYDYMESIYLALKSKKYYLIRRKTGKVEENKILLGSYTNTEYRIIKTLSYEIYKNYTSKPVHIDYFDQIMLFSIGFKEKKRSIIREKDVITYVFDKNYIRLFEEEYS